MAHYLATWRHTQYQKYIAMPLERYWTTTTDNMDRDLTTYGLAFVSYSHGKTHRQHTPYDTIVSFSTDHGWGNKWSNLGNVRNTDRVTVMDGQIYWTPIIRIVRIREATSYVNSRREWLWKPKIQRLQRQTVMPSLESRTLHLSDFCSSDSGLPSEWVTGHDVIHNTGSTSQWSAGHVSSCWPTAARFSEHGNALNSAHCGRVEEGSAVSTSVDCVMQGTNSVRWRDETEWKWLEVVSVNVGGLDVLLSWRHRSSSGQARQLATDRPTAARASLTCIYTLFITGQYGPDWPGLAWPGQVTSRHVGQSTLTSHTTVTLAASQP